MEHATALGSVPPRMEEGGYPFVDFSYENTDLLTGMGENSGASLDAEIGLVSCQEKSL